MGIKYIAETDPEGDVSWVWVAGRNSRKAKPFDPKNDKFDPNEKMDFHGARRDAIVSWLANAHLKRLRRG